MSVFRFTFIALLVAGLGTVAFADEMPRVDAARVGFSPSAAASKNVAALQKALNGGHKTVSVTAPGIYDLDATVYLDSHTRLACGKGVTLRKAAPYGFMLINRGVLTREWNERIAIDGLHIACNGHSRLPPPNDPAYGMRGQVSMFRVKGIEVTNFRCLDVKETQFCLHFCTFEDLLVDGFETRGRKDGVHLGPGKGFVIRNGVCQTGDDAIAGNGRLVATTGNVHPIAVDLTIENCPFRPGDKPDSLPDVSLGGKVTGKIVVRGNVEERPTRLAVPESVEVKR